jgi:hypothetical protein
MVGYGTPDCTPDAYVTRHGEREQMPMPLWSLCFPALAEATNRSPGHPDYGPHC